MIAVLTFSIIAALLVWLAGRKDAGRDPRLSILLLGLLVIFPVMQAWMPKWVELSASQGNSSAALPWGKILIGIWTVGFLIFSAKLILALCGLHRWRKYSVLIERIDRVEVRVLQDIQSPVAAGIFKPVIFVPTTWNECSADCRDLVLEHELSHHRRRDPLWRMLAEIARAIHWYHPLVHWMVRRLAIQCEFACDAAVLRKGANVKSYANVLCDFASSRPAPLLSLAMASAPSLESRVVRMLSPRGVAGTFMLVVLASVGLGAACLLSMIHRGSDGLQAVPADEVELRWSANPFPAE